MRFNCVMTAPVRSLEVGDLVAFDSGFTDQIISGRITGIVYYKYQLTLAQLEYMKEKGLDIPEDPYADLAGKGSVIVFGEFTNWPNHIYLELDINVAVFPHKKS